MYKMTEKYAIIPKRQSLFAKKLRFLKELCSFSLNEKCAKRMKLWKKICTKVHENEYKVEKVFVKMLSNKTETEGVYDS